VRETPGLLTALNQILEQQTFLLGDQFSVADVAVGSFLAHSHNDEVRCKRVPRCRERNQAAMSKIDLKAYPAVLNYVKQMSERHAFQRTLGQLTKSDPICCN